MEKLQDTLKEEEVLYDRVVDKIKARKERVNKGLINAIPWPFPRFSEEVIGLEKGKIYQVTAGPKAGKSKFTNFAFVYNTYDYIKTHNLPTKLVVKYFCLEESKEDLIAQFMSHVLFTKSKGKMVVSKSALMSTKSELPQEVIDTLATHREYIEGFLTAVNYIEDVHHPFGIYKHLLDYSEVNGTQLRKTVMYGETPKEVDDVYIPNEEEEIVSVIVDHVSLLSYKQGSSIQDAITQLSGFLINLRNKYGYSSVIVQQQALAQSSVEGIKFNQGEPTIAGLGDSKLTSRAVDISFGIYSPFYNKIPNHEDYDVKFYRDNIRFLSVLLSRHGGLGSKVGLYFNGAVNFFSELGKPNSPEETKQKNIVIQTRKNEIR